MTFSYKLDLDTLLIDLNAEIQVGVSVLLYRRARQMHTHTHYVKTITRSADAGCNNAGL